MFTGIIEGKGEIKDLKRVSGGMTITITSPFDLSEEKKGDSIAVNGICLTATAFNGNSFSADLSKETLSRTNLGKLSCRSAVNIERALKAGGRLGGHIVSGHIDGKGLVKKREQRGHSIYFEISAPDDIMRLVVEKGSIAVDGISLTVNKVGSDYFSLNIIPHTLELTTLSDRYPGDSVNIETDIIGKYVEKLMTGRSSSRGVDMNLLRECGFE